MERLRRIFCPYDQIATNTHDDTGSVVDGGLGRADERGDATDGGFGQAPAGSV